MNVRRGLAGILIAGALALPAAAQMKLAVGPDAGGYLCPDGRQLYVKSCYDASPDANCGIVNMHLPLRGGFQPETTDTRSRIAASVASCKVHPVAFKDGIVSLDVSKSATQAQAPASASVKTTVTVPGTDGKPLALARVPPAKDASIVYFVDENSRKQVAGGVVSIWTLWVYPEGRKEFPGMTAAWVDYAVNCPANSFEMSSMIRLDRQAKPLGGSKLDVKGPVPKDSVTDIVAAIACQRGGSLKGARQTTTLAAIDDAMSLPKATASAAIVEIPGAAGPLALARFMPTPALAHYVDESSIRQTNQPDVVAVWGLTIWPKGDPLKPSVPGRWADYRINCKTNDFEIKNEIDLGPGATLTAKRAVQVKGMVVPGTPLEVIANVACKRAPAPTAVRLTTLVNAIVDAAMAASAAEAAQAGNVPGTGGRPVVLVRLPPQVLKTTYYVDELSRKQTANADVVEIWVLRLTQQDAVSDVAVLWAQEFHNCKDGTFEIAKRTFIDRKGNPTTTQTGSVKGQVTKGAVSEVIAGIACKTGAPLKSVRLTSVVAAMAEPLDR